MYRKRLSKLQAAGFDVSVEDKERKYIIRTGSIIKLCTTETGVLEFLNLIPAAPGEVAKIKTHLRSKINQHLREMQKYQALLEKTSIDWSV
jgi:hypothetical protein